jgi:hypothetical protein
MACKRSLDCRACPVTVVVAAPSLPGLEENQPMTWIIIALLFAAAAAAGFRLQALTRDEPPEPPLAHRWRRTMGGGDSLQGS